MTEYWSTGAKLPEHIEVSTLGRKRTWLSKGGRYSRKLYEPHMLPQLPFKRYAEIAIGGNRTRKLHTMIYKIFIGPVPEGFGVHHVDGDKTNNCLYNLELISLGNHARLHDNGTQNLWQGRRSDAYIKEYRKGEYNDR